MLCQIIMAPQGSTSKEKAYRFISDPGHKENLSGRVRAACVTCRRKKIKCSGDVPCGTCEEKGIRCEGLTERKRPKKSLDQQQLQSLSFRDRHALCSPTHVNVSRRSSHHETMDLATKSTHQGAGSSQRPTETLQKLNNGSSHDSGYSSGMQSGQDTAASRLPRLETSFSFDSFFAECSSANYNSSTEISPSTTESQDWSFLRRQGSAGYCETEAAGSDVSQSTHVGSAAASTTSVDWMPPQRERSRWWRDSRASDQAAPDLLTAAAALEEQAQSLRRLASQQGTDATDDTRRQTITFPLHSRSASPPLCSPQPVSGGFDDLSLLLADHTSGSGITPLPAEFASWWDANPKLSTPFGFQQPATSAQQPEQFSMMSSMDPTDTGWHGSSCQGPILASHAPLIETTRSATPSIVQSLEARQTGHGHRQPLNLYAGLYSWPE